MRCLVETNDPVLLSYVEAQLAEAGVVANVLDRHMSLLEGSIGVLPRRVMVAGDAWGQAAEVLELADLAQWVRRDGR